MAYGIVNSQASVSTVTYVTVPILSTDTFVYSSDVTIDVAEYLEDYTPERITISGTRTAQSTGDYTLTLDLSDPNTYWSDGTVTAKNLTWKITKQPVAVPTVSNTSKTYNAEQQSPTISDYDESLIAVSGNTGMNAGDYTLTFSLTNDNYEFDSTNTTVVWTIAKAAGNVNVDPSDITLDPATLSQSATITRVGTGSITATIGDTDVATCEVDSNTLIITSGASAGNTSVIVNVAEDDNYLSTYTTVMVSNVLVSYTLNDNSWEAISQVAQAGTGDVYWDVGDCKEIVLNGTIGGSNTTSQTYTAKTLCVFILDFNHAMNGVAENNIIFGGFKTALKDGKDVALQGFKINSGNTNSGGWKGCDMRYEALGNGTSKNTDAVMDNITSPRANTVMSAIPADMRTVVRIWSRWIDNTGGYNGTGDAKNGNSANKVTEVKDVCTLLAECEIGADRAYANADEMNHSTRMAYYASGNSTAKMNAINDSSAVNWWECSPAGYFNGYSSNNFCLVHSNGVTATGRAFYEFALAPAWKI